jgi:putative hydrolase of the HAD superfamily
VGQPDARIYQIALARLGVRPADTLFVDDTPGHVAAAQSLGLAGQVPKPYGSLLTGDSR